MPNRRRISNSFKSTSARLDDLIADVQAPRKSSNPVNDSAISDRDLRQKIYEINFCVRYKGLDLPPNYSHWFLNARDVSVGQFRDWIEQVYEKFGVFDIYWKFSMKNRKL